MTRGRWRIAATLLGVALVVAIAVWYRSPGAPAPAPQTMTSPPSNGASGVPARPVDAADLAGSAAPRARGDEEIEVCGFGFVSPEEVARSNTLQKALENQFDPAPEVVKRVSDALRGSTRPEARSLGDWLAAVDAAGRVTTPYNEQLELCGDNKKCSEPVLNEVRTARQEAMLSGIDAMARQAVDSRNPAVYAMAIQACGTYRFSAVSGGACQLITLDRWAQLDPDNAVPWTHLAEAAASRNDAAGVSEALYRASIARTSRLYGDSLLSIVEPALSSGLTELERLQMATEIVGMQAAWTFPPLGTFSRMCSEEAVRDGNRHQTCDAYASMLLDKGNTLIESGIGVRLAERLRWPAERLDALRLERTAMREAAYSTTSDMASCMGWKRTIDGAFRRARLGEVGDARAIIAASGKTVDEWARSNLEQAQAAASAAAVASAASGN